MTVPEPQGDSLKGNHEGLFMGLIPSLPAENQPKKASIRLSLPEKTGSTWGVSFQCADRMFLGLRAQDEQNSMWRKAKGSQREANVPGQTGVDPKVLYMG